MKQDKHIEFGALRIFAAVAEAETLTQAADTLGITQSAVSQTLKHLETITGAELIDRRSRPTALTPAGKVLHKHARSIIADTRKMLADIQIAAEGSVHQLNVGMIDSFGDVAGVQILEFARSQSVRLSLRSGVTTALARDLTNREIDLLISSDATPNKQEFEVIPLLRDPFLIITPGSLKLTENLSPETLAKELPFIHYDRRSRIGAMSDLIARRLNIALNTEFELDSTQTMLRFVQAGHGWAMMTGLCLIRYPELLQGVRVHPLSNGSNARYLHMIFRRNEMGAFPERLAQVCRTIYSEELVPQMTQIAPWLAESAYAVKESPLLSE